MGFCGKQQLFCVFFEQASAAAMPMGADWKFFTTGTPSGENSTDPLLEQALAAPPMDPENNGQRKKIAIMKKTVGQRDCEDSEDDDGKKWQ